MKKVWCSMIVMLISQVGDIYNNADKPYGVVDIIEEEI